MDIRMESPFLTFLIGTALSLTILLIPLTDPGLLQPIGALLLPLVGGVLYGIGKGIGQHLWQRYFPDRESKQLSLWQRWKQRRSLPPQ